MKNKTLNVVDEQEGTDTLAQLQEQAERCVVEKEDGKFILKFDPTIAGDLQGVDAGREYSSKEDAVEAAVALLKNRKVEA